MRAYMELNVMVQLLFAVFNIVLILAAACLLVWSGMLHVGRKYLVGNAVLTAAVFVVFQGIDEVRVFQDGNSRFMLLPGQIISVLPAVIVGVILVLFAVVEIIFLAVMVRLRKNMLSTGVIKESLDTLPDGVCFYAEDGQPFLINRQMNRL